METKTIAELGIRLTPETGSYWNNNGAYQEEGDRLYAEMVPDSGSASTLNGELIRAINRLFYEYCNNGNCNAAIPHTLQERAWEIECEDEDDVDWDEIESVEIDKFYEKFITLIEDTLCEKISSKEVHAVMSRIREIIEEGAYNTSCRCYFSEKNVNTYSRMCDMVIWYVLNTEDTELPSDYDKD
ncbi:MAG: hypothetical protein IJ882_02285 [Paludibacteraceae bacterium]|nr:hypothetical protein [Paludibacteraceae bacterium]